MHARVSRFGGAGEARASARSVDDLLPDLRNMDGFRGVMSLVDSGTGNSLAITLWESEDAMRASEAQADEMRQELADSAGAQILAVERYEVETLHLEP